MRLLDIEHEWVHIGVLDSETHTDDFTSINPNAKIPVLQIGTSEFLSESNAILNYLAEGTEFLPDSGIDRARVLQWQFFEQYSHEPYIAVARFINKYLGLPLSRSAEYKSKQEGGHKALAVMEKQLAETAFLVGDSTTIADISLYAYTHVAEEGGFDLEQYPNINRWIKRIEALPGYCAIEAEDKDSDSVS